MPSSSNPDLALVRTGVRRALSALALVAVLSACGGGQDRGSGQAATLSAPASIAFDEDRLYRSDAGPGVSGRWYYYPAAVDGVTCADTPLPATGYSPAGCQAWFDQQAGPAAADGIVHSASPWWIDPNHRDAHPPYLTAEPNPDPGLGYINIVAFVALPQAAHAPVDLSDATVTLRLRKDGAFDPLEAPSRVGRRKGHLYFWFQTAPRTLPPAECTAAPDLGEDCTRQSDYIFSAPDLADESQFLDAQLAAGEWKDIVLRLPADPARWTCLGRGDNPKYECAPITQALKNVSHIGLIVAPVCTAPDPAHPLAVFTCPDNGADPAANLNRGAIDVARVEVKTPRVQPVEWLPAIQGWRASRQQIMGGDVSVEFEAANRAATIGLSQGVPAAGRIALEAAIELQPGGQFSVLGAMGTRLATQPADTHYDMGDRFRISVETDARRVVVQRNGMPVASWALSSGWSVTGAAISAWASDDGTGVEPPSARLSGDVAAWQFGHPVVFVDWAVSASAVLMPTQPAGLMRRPAGDGGWSPVAHSTVALASGDGAVEFTVPDTTHARRVGLGRPYAGTDVHRLGYQLYVPNLDGVDKDVFVVEVTPAYPNGRYLSVGPYEAGDRFRIAIEDGRVTFRRNGVLLYRPEEPVQPADYPLAVNVSLFEAGSRIDSVKLTGLLQPLP